MSGIFAAFPKVLFLLQTAPEERRCLHLSDETEVTCLLRRYPLFSACPIIITSPC